MRTEKIVKGGSFITFPSNYYALIILFCSAKSVFCYQILQLLHSESSTKQFSHVIHGLVTKTFIQEVFIQKSTHGVTYACS